MCSSRIGRGSRLQMGMRQAVALCNRDLHCVCMSMSRVIGFDQCDHASGCMVSRAVKQSTGPTLAAVRAHQRPHAPSQHLNFAGSMPCACSIVLVQRQSAMHIGRLPSTAGGPKVLTERPAPGDVRVIQRTLNVLTSHARVSSGAQPVASAADAIAAAGDARIEYDSLEAFKQIAADLHWVRSQQNWQLRVP